MINKTIFIKIFGIILILVGLFLVVNSIYVLVNIELIVENIIRNMSFKMPVNAAENDSVFLRNFFVKDSIIQAIAGFFCLISGLTFLRMKKWGYKFFISGMIIAIIFNIYRILVESFFMTFYSQRFINRLIIILIFIVLLVIFSLKKVRHQFKLNKE